MGMDEKNFQIDLRGTALPRQMESINGALIEVVNGSTITIITEQQMLATYVLPIALDRGVRCRVSPQKEVWKIELFPKG